MNTQFFLKLLIAAAEDQVEQNGGKALEAVERMGTLPEKDIRRVCAAHKMDEAQTLKAISLFRKLGDAVTDATVYLASGGRIQPD